VVEGDGEVEKEKELKEGNGKTTKEKEEEEEEEEVLSHFQNCDTENRPEIAQCLPKVFCQCAGHCPLSGAY
jgi:hypothetical protein